ncbi:MAG: sulfatase-like hydrolase/transferase [Armatimonadota bacterium]|jgi:arylsulfatase A-like enzyme
MNLRDGECPGKVGRRRFIRDVTAAAAAVGAGGPGRAAERPNILIVLSDQERELADRAGLKMPNRDRLDAMGTRFTAAYCTTPQCSPARATLLTGRYPHEAGVVTNIGAVGSAPLSPEIPCLGTAFGTQGYATGYLGKWHLGSEGDGLDEFGFPGRVKARGEKLAQATAEWIRGQTERPWLLFSSFINPHDIYHIRKPGAQVRVRPEVELPPNFEDDLSAKPPPQQQFLDRDQGTAVLEYTGEDWLRYRSYYRDLIEMVDGHLGAILDALEQTKQMENTIIVYSSDHGDMGGAHGLPFKGPFMYEELIHVPLTVAWPGTLPEGRGTDALVSHMDLIPTLCGLSGVEWPEELRGADLTALLRGRRTKVHEQVFVEYHSKQQWANPIRTVRRRRWKLNQYVDGYRELYDLRNDPGEVRDLAGTGHGMEEELGAALTAWRRETGDPLAAGDE